MPRAHSAAVAAGSFLMATLGSVADSLPAGAQEVLPVAITPESGFLGVTTFTVSGSGCVPTDEGSGVSIELTPLDNVEFGGGFTVVVEPEIDGTWRSELVVPSDLHASEYHVVVHCWPAFLFEEGLNEYEVRTIFVAFPRAEPPPPATAVAGRPNFTG